MIELFNILDADDDNLKKMGNSLGLSLDEMIVLKNYFSGLKRNPEDIEIQAIAQAWSEHSCYKSSKIYLKRYFSGLKSPYTILTMEDDAAVVSFNDDYAYVVKMESHNHPSAVEPYGGAATGVGGIIRDVLCMGAQPVALIDSLYFGNPENTSGILTERFIINRVVAGIRDYGNRVGIPTVAGSVDFDDSYNTIPLVNAGCIGIVKKDKIVRSRVEKENDILIVCGGRTGRDGIHGVNFASKTLNENDSENRNAVQLGNPIIKEPLIHAILEINDLGIIDGMKDLGGGGFSSAVSELLYAGGLSGIINLDNVLLKDANMEPWEIWVSESQERMLLAMEEKNLKLADEIFKKWGIEYSVIGRTVKSDNLIITYKGKKILDMNLKFLTSGPVYARNYRPVINNKSDIAIREPENYEKFIRDFISRPNICSRFNIVRQYDFTVRGCTITKPFTGFPNHETHSDASIIKPLENSMSGLSITSGSRGKIVSIDAYNGTMWVLAEAYKNTISSGSIPHSIIDALNFGNPENPETMFKFKESVRAISDFCRYMNLPLVSGNVSFYNQSKYGEIKPTPNILMIGIMDNIVKRITPDLKSTNSGLYVIGNIINTLAGSEYSEMFNAEYSYIPPVNLNDLKILMELLKNNREIINSAHDVSQGGLIMALLEMAFGGSIGIDADLSQIDGKLNEKLFSELGTAIVIEVKNGMEKAFEEKFKSVNPVRLGKTVNNKIIIKNLGKVVINEEIDNLRHIWEHGLDKYI